MRWTTVGKTHVNTNNVDCFKWEDGNLYVWFVSERLPTEWEDPDKQLYKKLCSDLGLNVYEEVAHD